MDELHPRHRYGTYALILALLALAFAGFSKGAVWATVEDESSTSIEDDFGDFVVNASIEGDLHLREMDITILSEIDVIGFPGAFEPTELSETETYDELAQSSEGNVSSTFEAMDTAGAIAEWMIWIGMGGVLITAILCLCSLAQVMPSRPTLLAGGISSAFLFFTPIIWYFNLPSDGKYTNESMLGNLAFLFEEHPELLINFEPVPSTGVILSILSGLCGVAMMWMIVLYNRAELTEEKPSWMIADDSTILPYATLSGLFCSDGESISLNFSPLKSQPQKLIIPIIEIVVIIGFSIVLAGTWASYTIDLDGTSVDFSYNQEEMIFGQGSESLKFSYDLGEDSDKEMGEVIGQSVSIGTIAIWMLTLGLIWRFAVSIGGAQKIPTLCQHHRIIDTLLMTGGSLLAFASLLYFMINSPSSAELFSDMPDEMIDGGTSFPILGLMIVLVPNTFAVFTFGEFGAPVRNFLRSFDIPIPGEEGDADSAPSSGENSGIATLLQNRFDDMKISGLPWVTIGVVILVLFALGGGGYLAYKIVGSSDDSDDSQTMMLYDLSYDAWSSSQAFDSVNVGGGQVVTWTFDQESAPDDSSLYAIFITFDYDETDPDLFCDELDVVLSGTPTMFDNQNSTGSGSADDCGQVVLSLYVERGLEGSQLDGSQVLLNSDEVDSTQAYFNEHDGGMGTWEFSIGVEDVGAGFENGEEVTMTIEPMFATMSITEVV
jgi:hypothetical protein